MSFFCNPRLVNSMIVIFQSIRIMVPYIALTGASMAFYVVATTFGGTIFFDIRKCQEAVCSHTFKPIAYAVMTICGADEGERILSEHNWGWRTWVSFLPFFFCHFQGYISPTYKCFSLAWFATDSNHLGVLPPDARGCSASGDPNNSAGRGTYQTWRVPTIACADYVFTTLGKVILPHNVHKKGIETDRDENLNQNCVQGHLVHCLRGAGTPSTT